MDDGPLERAEVGGRVRPLRDELLRHLGAVGVVAGVELDPVGRRLLAEAQDDRARVVDLDRLEDEVRDAEQRVDRVPSGPVIVLGSAWNARYMSDGASTARRGPGMAPRLLVWPP